MSSRLCSFCSGPLLSLVFTGHSLGIHLFHVFPLPKDERWQDGVTQALSEKLGIHESMQREGLHISEAPVTIFYLGLTIQRTLREYTGYVDIQDNYTADYRIITLNIRDIQVDDIVPNYPCVHRIMMNHAL